MTRKQPSSLFVRGFLVLSLLLFASAPAPGQRPEPPELLVEAPGAEQSLTAQQQRLLETVRERPTTAEARLFRLANLSRLERGHSVRLTFAPGWVVTLLPEHVESRGPGDFTYFGAIDGELGNAILVVQAGELTGSLRIDLDLYQIEPIGNGVHALIRVDQRAYPEEGPEPAGAASVSSPLSVPTPGNKARIPAKASATDQPQSMTAASSHPVMKVLVAYTPSAASAHGSIKTMIQLAVDETNVSFQNSAVTPRIELVKTVQVSYTESKSNNHLTDLDRFRGTSDGYMDNVHSLRNSYGADLMVLVINDGAVCGRASAIGATATTAFATVHYTCATGNYSFGHELGHLAGNRHDNDSSTSPYAYGHGYQYSTGGWRTIMAVGNLSLTRIQRWANPYVTYNGVATGTTSYNNTARVWNERGPTMAGFRSDPFCAPIPNNMAAWWPLDETSGTTTADLVPNGPAGTRINGPVPVTGKVAGGLYFDGSNDYVRIPNGAGSDFGSGDLSIAGWIKTTQNTTVYTVLMDKRPTDVGSYAGYSLHMYSGRLGIQLANATGYYNYDSNAFVADGLWHHFVISVDRDSTSGLRFYLDGEEIGPALNPTGSMGSLSNSADLFLGTRYNLTGLFQGTLDEVQLYDRALTASEALRAHAANSKGTCRPQPLSVGLSCYWILTNYYYCDAMPIGGFGPYSYYWTYYGQGTLYPNGSTAEIYLPSYCDPYQANTVQVTLTDLYARQASDYEYIYCDSGGPVAY